MKQCISRVISFLTFLWRTLKRYVCRIKIFRKDIDHDNFDEIIIDLKDDQNDKIEEDNNHDI